MNDPTPATPTPGQLAAERYAALVAIRDAFDALAKDAKTDALKHAAGLKSASWSTLYGAVNVTTTDPKIVLDEDAFLAMVQEHYPDDVVVTYSVSPALRAAFLSRLVEVGGQVVHRDTGEVVDFATVTPRGNPTVSYPSSSAQRDAKAYARMLLEDKVATFVDGLREVTA
jgi:hypothetical protein